MSERGQTRTFQHVDDAAFREVLEYHKGTTKDHLDRFEGEWQKLWQSRQTTADIALLTTCSHAKPYGKSFIHMGIRQELWRIEALQYMDIIHVSSAGIIPTECGSQYPFCAYDWNDSEASSGERTAYQQRAEERMRAWYHLYGKHKYKRLLVYFEPNDDNLPVFEKLQLEMRLEIVGTISGDTAVPWALEPDVDDCLVHPRNLEKLRQAVRRALQI